MERPLPYTIKETLYDRDGTTLYRAVGNADHAAVILKVLDPRRCRRKALDRQRSEYEIGRTLGLPTVARPLALETYQGMPAPVIEDFGGQPLDRLLADLRMPFERFLAVAMRIAGAVADVHRQGFVHKDLKPQNILVNPATGEVRLADFGLASRLPREQQAARPPQLIEGSLPYMSPEQTGRMNRAVDSRSDLYSLGVTFYQMLAGRLPWEARDPVEWVHCHVARAPTWLSQLVPDVPEAIARIVMKLLAKMADDRYQTARGLQHDLERCLEQLRTTGQIDPFPLGERDTPDRLQIPQKLYGREGEIAALMTAFERVVETGAPELVLVSGYSGIGKSSLVHELEKPILRQRGLFVAGKFDRYQRDVPYSTIVPGFRELVLEILAQSEERIAAWREQLQAAVGMNGQLLVDVIPQVELVIGPQSPVPELPPTEAQNRFRIVFRHFIGVFARKEHPLTLSLDDLQWADWASLALLQDLVTHPGIRFLLVVGTYRDNEVTPAHPLIHMLEAARKGGAHVSDVVLGPLSNECLTAFIGDALRCPPHEAAPLAALVREKTAANPFFAIQFLTFLHEEHLLELDERTATWRWDLARIRTRSFTDNVVDLMVGRLKRLPAETQEALKLIACLGNSADATTVATALGRSSPETDAAVWEALCEGLLFRADGSYRFLHDRVRESAYSLVPEESRPSVHLRIGRLLLSHLSAKSAMRWIPRLSWLTIKPVLLSEPSDDELRSFCVDEEHVRLMREMGFRTLLAVPLVARGQTLGVISLCSAAPERRYGRADLELAQELAQRAAVAVDNACLYREAQEAIRLRDEFLSVASHELYTPITSLMLSLDAMARTEQVLDPRAMRKLLDLVSRQGRRLIRLIGDLLDVSRIETGRLMLELTEIELGALVGDVVERLEPDLARSRCSVSIQARAPVAGRWDRSRLDQVLTNLLSNAMKFAPGKPVEISIGAERGTARLAVRDFGIGVSLARQPRIFEGFERAAPAAHYGGLGLGLYISRRIVEAHGGSIAVESQPGTGSTFTIELPCAGPPDAGGQSRWREA